MKITVEYEGRPIVVDIPDETLKQIADSQKKKTGWEKPSDNCTYWFSDRTCCAEADIWDNVAFDNLTYDCGNCFTSKELAENIARYQSLDLRIRRRIAEMCEPITRTGAYVICWNGNEIVIVDNIRNYGGWRFDNYQHAEQIINEFREELMWYFTEFKDRMDVNA